MKRRQFISFLAGAAAASSFLWPLAARAQQRDRVRRIGVLVPLPAIVWVPFFEELARQGFVEGQNLAVDRRGFDASYDRFATIAAELVSASPDAILCGGDAAIRAAQAATTTIPVVALTDDMVGAGLVRSLARPGANTTGVSILAADLDGKRQEVLIDFFRIRSASGIVGGLHKIVGGLHKREQPANPAVSTFFPPPSPTIRVIGSPTIQPSPGSRQECTPVEHDIAGLIIGPTDLCER